MKERIKTLVLWLLLLSAVYMTVRTWIYDGNLLTETAIARVPFLARIFGVEPAAAVVEYAPAVWEFTAAARPARCAVMLDGVRQGAGQGSPAVAELFDRMSVYIGEALATAGEADEITSAQREEYMRLDGVYFEYLVPIRLEILAAWLSAESKLSGEAVSIAILSGDDGCTFIYEDSHGVLSAAHTAVVAQSWPVPSGAEPCALAYELGRDYPGVSPGTLMVPVGETAVLSSEDASVFTAAEPCLRALGFVPSTSFYYDEPGGSRVYVDGERSFRVSPDGSIVYSSPVPARQGDPLYVPSAPNPRAGRIEQARRLADMLAPALGAAYFSLWDETERENGSEITFVAMFRAMPVLGASAAFVSVTIDSNTVLSITARLRHYAETPETTLPLSAEMAGALSDIPGARMALIYDDNGSGQCSAGWGSGE